MLGRLVASAGHCRCEPPGEADVLERIEQTVRQCAGELIYFDLKKAWL
jgi:hypothetical protein